MSSGARAQQLSQRVAHLEADLALLRQRKAQLEHENEVLAAAAAEKPDLEARLREALIAGARLEAECRRHRAEGARREGLEAQQAEIARSFSDLQGVVTQLVRRLAEINAQHQRLADEKGAAEAAAAALRVELQKWRTLRATAAASAPAGCVGHCAGHCGTATGRAANALHGRSQSWACTSCGGRRRGCHTCRLRCRVDLGQQRLTGTPPRRGGLAPAAGRGCAAVQQRGATVGWLQQPPLATAAGDQQRRRQLQQQAALAEAQIECELLRQSLASEERACDQAKQGRSGLFQECSCAEARTSELQSELRDMLTSWSAHGDEEAGATAVFAAPAELGDAGGCSSSGGGTCGAGASGGVEPLALH